MLTIEFIVRDESQEQGLVPLVASIGFEEQKDTT